MNSKLLIASAFLLMIFANSIYAQDWPQFMGPNRDNTSPQKGIMRSWHESGPEVLWTVDIGIGYGGPVVKEGKVYLLDRDDKVGDNLRCFDLTTGKELWNYAYEAPGAVMFPGSRSVPVVDDAHVYSCGPYGHLYCFDIATHKPVWNKNVWADFGGKEIPTWAISQGPFLYNNMLIIASQAPEAGVVAYNKLTGEIIWKTPSLGEVGYVSPTLVKIDGNDHVVMITASNRSGDVKGNVVGLNPLTGKMLWNYNNWNCRIPVPAAIDAGDNKLLIIGGYELGATMLKVEMLSDGNYAAKELFTTEEFGDQTKSAIMHNAFFYAQYGTNQKRDGMVCMSMNGEIMWKTKRDPDFNKGSMILADGLILATDGSKMLYLIEPDPTAFKPIAKAEILGSKASDNEISIATRVVGGATQNWAPIALADGKLLIRNQSRLMCVKVAE